MVLGALVVDVTFTHVADAAYVADTVHTCMWVVVLLIISGKKNLCNNKLWIVHTVYTAMLSNYFAKFLIIRLFLFRFELKQLHQNFSMVPKCNLQQLDCYF